MTTKTSYLATAAQGSWRRFLETFEPLRSPLYRYCRYLTRSPWDAEDLAQDALARAFVTLARMGGQEPTNPRAWLFRIASNLWIDQTRRRREVPTETPEPVIAHAIEPRAPRDAAGTLLVTLSPLERAAVVLKDVFEFALDEIAESLGTTVGAVKAALHRGRGKLAEDSAPETATAPVPAVLDAFCAAFNAGDIDRLTALLLDTAVVEVVGATTQYGPEAARSTVLFGMLFGFKRLADPKARALFDARFADGGLANEPPRVEARFHRGRWLLLHWYKHVDGEAVRAVTTLELDGDRAAVLANYFYNADFLIDIGGELGVPVRVNGHRWWIPEVQP
ncbi:MAG TPA: sigma-70 family RNA polymerase sigma factor [Polyangia bacterium]|jgi:RNA polymerase sigma-70 factor (ECF subfamily)